MNNPRTEDYTEARVPELVERVTELFGAGYAHRWIEEPQKLLGGESPQKLIKSGHIDEVFRLLDQIRDSVYL